MDDTTKLLLTLLVSPALGALAGLATTQYKLRREGEIDRDKQKEHVRLRILSPLLVASEDLLERMTDVRRRRKDPMRGGDMRRWFLDIAERTRHDPRSLAHWANDEGYFAISTLYVTAVYFSYAGTMRRDFPFFELQHDAESTLLSHLSEVRTSIGGKFGIWEVMQDSLGMYVAREGSVLSYRQFCELILSEPEAVWFHRLIDFYRDIHLKLDDQLDNVEHSLKGLIRFLRANLALQVLEYKLTAASVDGLRARELPVVLVDGLRMLTERDFLNEVDFVDAVVACIGQDMSDDYKPSIMKAAVRRRI